MLVQFLFVQEKNINSLLLIGHSITHTITSINNIGGNFNSDNFIYFQKIESIRQKIILPHIIFLVGLCFFSVSSWSGYTRYFVPTFLSLCLYFSIGVNFLGNLIYNKKLY